MKAQDAGAVLREHAIEDESVDVHVEIEGPAKALNDGDAPLRPSATPSRREAA